MATTPDFLVGLYLRYQRHGEGQPQSETPVSSQNFKSDLKHLAEDLKQFENPHGQTVTHAQTQTHIPAHGHPQVEIQPPPAAARAAQWGYPRGHQFGASPTPAPPPPQPTYTPPPEPLRPTTLDDLLDARSLKMVHDVKLLLNLGSDLEACRALLSMGFERMRILFTQPR
jgi:hypothetical protein